MKNRRASFQPKVGGGYYLGLLTLLLIWLFALSIEVKDSGIILVAVLIKIGFRLWSRYIIKDELLIVREGLLSNVKISINEIIKIENHKDQLKIISNTSSTLVSPRNKTEFLAALVAINSSIEVT